MAGNHVRPRTSSRERPLVATDSIMPTGVIKVERPTARLRKSQPSAIPPLLVWERDDYPRVDCGRRMVRGHEIQGPEWVRAFSRWSLRIEFHMMDELGTVSLFVNLGTNRDRPTVGGRRSNYYRFWTMANGTPPRKGEAMHYDIFIGKCFWALVENSVTDNAGRQKPEHDVY